MYDPLASLNNPCSSEDHGCAAKPPKTLQETFNHKNQTEETNVVMKGVLNPRPMPTLKHKII